MNATDKKEVIDVVGKLGLLAVKYGQAQEDSQEYQTFAMLLGMGVGAVMRVVQESGASYDDCVKLEQALVDMVDSGIELGELDAEVAELEKVNGVLPEYIDRVFFTTLQSANKVAVVFEIIDGLN